METTLHQTPIFSCLREQVTCIVEATRLVRSGISRDATETVRCMERILELECQGNRIARRSLRDLDIGVSDLKPFGKADLRRVCWHLDGVLTTLEDLATRILAYRVAKFTPAAVKLGDIVNSCGGELPNLIDSAGNVQTVGETAARIYELEEQTRSTLLQAMTELFDSEVDAVRLMKTKDVYEFLEKIVDAFADAARAIEDMVLKVP